MTKPGARSKKCRRAARTRTAAAPDRMAAQAGPIGRGRGAARTGRCGEHTPCRSVRAVVGSRPAGQCPAGARLAGAHDREARGLAHHRQSQSAVRFATLRTQFPIGAEAVGTRSGGKSKRVATSGWPRALSPGHPPNHTPHLLGSRTSERSLLGSFRARGCLLARRTRRFRGCRRHIYDILVHTAAPLCGVGRNHDTPFDYRAAFHHIANFVIESGANRFRHGLSFQVNKTGPQPPLRRTSSARHESGRFAEAEKGSPSLSVSDTLLGAATEGRHLSSSVKRTTADLSASGASGNWMMLYGASGSDLVVRLAGDSASTLRFLTTAR
jgi:hypothetical protein